VAVRRLLVLPGVGERLAGRLVAAGYTTLRGLADASPEALQEIDGIGLKSAERIQLAAREALTEAEPATAAPEGGAAGEGTEA
jgi:N utilization substance protein A